LYATQVIRRKGATVGGLSTSVISCRSAAPRSSNPEYRVKEVRPTILYTKRSTGLYNKLNKKAARERAKRLFWPNLAELGTW
jgi:hypothetical protein